MGVALKVFGSEWLKLLSLFFLGLLLRLWFFFTYIFEDPKRAFYTIDSYTYEFPAISLLERGRYINDCPRPLPEDFPQRCIPSKEPEIYRPPGYPLFIALHYMIFGESRNTVIFSQNIMDSLKIPLIYFISKSIGLSGKVSYLPALIYAVSPSAVVFAQTFMTENLQSFALVLMLLFLLSELSWMKLAVSGVLAGVLSLIHPIWFFFSSSFPLIVLLLSRRIIASLVAAVSIALVISPWIIRNYLIWKIVIFRPGADVFLCEIRKKMYKGEWVEIGRESLDIDVLNRASERFGWGVSFRDEKEAEEYPLDLTKRTHIARICREDILRKFWRYPFEIHFAGFIRLLPPFGVAQLYYMASGDIKPSGVEITRYIIPYIFEGKIKEAVREIREKRAALLSPFMWSFYILGWLIRTSTLILAFISLLKPTRFNLLLFAIFLYGTFLITTFESAQPRRFYTVEGLIYILSAFGVQNIFFRSVRSRR